LNKAELIADVALRADVSQATEKKAVDAFIDAVKASLSVRENVTLVGFGTFKTAERTARVGRNPQTGKALKIAAAINAKFSAGKKLKDAVKLSGQPDQKAKPRK